MQKDRIQWAGQILIHWLLCLITYYWFIEHDNFLTIIFLILFATTTLIFSILGKKGILFDIFQKNDDSNDKFTQFMGVMVLYTFAFYARDTGTGKSIFYVTFFIFSLIYIIGQYKKLNGHK